MNNDPTPGAGKNAELTPDPGKTVDVSKLVSDTVNAALAPVLEGFSSLAKTVNGLAAERRRASEGGPDPKDGKAKEPKEAEIAALRDELVTIRQERNADRKRLALKDALDAYGDQIVGRKHLEKLIAADLDLNSANEVVALVDGKHVSLKDHVKAYAEDPQFRAPTGKQGTGRPEAAGGNPHQQPERTILATDQAAINANWRDIMAGKVRVVQQG